MEENKYKWSLLPLQKEIIVELEYFTKTDHDREIDRICGYIPLTLNDHICRTYEKYLYKHGTQNIVIETNEIEPQSYKVAAHTIKIVTKKLTYGK